MGSSSKSITRPPADQVAPSGQLNPTPGGEPPQWQSILPQGGAPAQLGDQVRMEPFATAAPPPLAPSAPATQQPPTGAAPRAAGVDEQLVASLPPNLRSEYMAAKAAGNEALAARILLAATMGPRGEGGPGRGGGYTTSGRGGTQGFGQHSSSQRGGGLL